MGSVLSSAHDVQLVAVPSHEAHVALQLTQVPRPLMVVRNCPRAHSEVHVPAPSSKEAPGKHEAQPVAVPSVHVAHEASHAAHAPFVAYLPLGQLALHAPSSKYGVPIDGHVRHEVLPPPVHVSHEPWQLVHFA